MVELQLRTHHMIFGMSAATMASGVLLLIPYLNMESSIMLIIFNFLFVSLLFPLGGTLRKKLSLFLLGNVIGWTWNYIFSAFANGASGYFGKNFEAAYMIVNPLLNLVWIVSFWSLSLATLSASRKGGRFPA